jgi:hypothetical protein
MIEGILKKENGLSFIDENGIRHFENRIIWDGYLNHWENRSVFARELNQRDYKKKEPIIIVWPDDPDPDESFVDLYYNERLVKYFTSTLGHTAINVNGSIFNFSHLINENEIMSREEYFYRPALGEFAPSPNNGRFEILEDGRAYYDKFGRNFMRTIHQIRIFGLDADHFTSYLNSRLELILNTPLKDDNPEKYRDFSIIFNNCATIIRDAFHDCGFKKIRGRFPRDLFVSAAYSLFRTDTLEVSYTILRQLVVPEAPKSQVSPLINAWNYFRLKELRIFNNK